MEVIQKLKVVEVLRVSPPSGSVPETSLPLTFFDVFWMRIPPVQRLFFYEFSESNTITTAHFLQSLLPNLKHSLSLTLQLFYPLSANLRLSPQTDEYEIHYVDGDSVSLTVAESTAEIFHQLVADKPKDTKGFHPLLPNLPTSSSLLASQVTLFPKAGISIGICFHHVAADGRSLTHFMKSWSSINKTGDLSSIAPLPSYNRAVIKDPGALKKMFTDQMAQIKFEKSVERTRVDDPARATFVLTRCDIERLRKRVTPRVDPDRIRFSTFALACGYVSVCLVKARGHDVRDEVVCFSFWADCRTRLNPPVPDTYFGNCIASVFAEANGRNLGGDEGLVTAAEAIGRAVERLGDGVLRGAENWIPKYASMANKRIILVAGSPRFRVYETDFGWGRPRKTEVVSIDRTEGVYIGDSRDEEGGIEFGLVMPRWERPKWLRCWSSLQSLPHQAPLQKLLFLSLSSTSSGYNSPQSNASSSTSSHTKTTPPTLTSSTPSSQISNTPSPSPSKSSTHSAETSLSPPKLAFLKSVTPTATRSHYRSSSPPDDFHHLISNQPKDAAKFHNLAPNLPDSSALLSLQVTLFPNSGICIGYCLHHAVADGRSVTQFMKSWSSINRAGDASLIATFPLYDRALVKEPPGLKRTFMEQMEEYKFGKTTEQMDVRTLESPLRATFVLTRSDIERLKQRVMDRPNPAQKPFRCSTFSVACGYAWVCLIKARRYVEDRTVYFSFAVDCRTRVDQPIPDLYFGNCIAGVFANASGRDLGGKDGLATASEAISGAVEGLRLARGGADKWIPSYVALANERIVTVAGSPRFRDTDFGWGRPRKTEVVSIDRTGAIYIGDCRDEEGGMEIGLVIPTSEMSAFSSFFNDGLKV
ncbi:LOW QUALITY PROTEIN: ATP-NAD kinase-like domain-containing protein [Cinnamomum micranthum f. kanehirae]|uniref:ATP-NAD kinase-like domain-containing protein n=1 Tax=Cinnamomum micranthum f. kanehirae TaxID=337451 RepID=A0A443PQK3_9MAGN|nr:LOW QUALITY PROTEIN: ATP-NAD kinase-like domain-containing protein [Cinnamomum micranthum f. kanehirae]